MMGAVSIVEVPRDVLDAAQLSPDDVRVELAVALYAQGRLSVGKARELARMSLWEFRQLLAVRQVAPRYGEEDLTEDAATLHDMERR
jgi:predicted HTH domain antitoxin